MLRLLGYSSLDELIDAAVPRRIRMNRPLDLPAGLSEHEALGRMRKMASRNELYRERKMKEHPPTRAEAVKLMAREPNLIKRPLLVRGQRVVYGFDEDEFQRVMARG